MLDIGAFLDQQAAHFLALGAGLVRLELHAEDGLGENPDFVGIPGHFYTTALATSSGMDLGLDNPDLATEFLGNLYRLIDG